MLFIPLLDLVSSIVVENLKVHDVCIKLFTKSEFPNKILADFLMNFFNTLSSCCHCSARPC